MKHYHACDPKNLRAKRKSSLTYISAAMKIVVFLEFVDLEPYYLITVLSLEFVVRNMTTLAT